MSDTKVTAIKGEAPVTDKSIPLFVVAASPEQYQDFVKREGLEDEVNVFHIMSDKGAGAEVQPTQVVFLEGWDEAISKLHEIFLDAVLSEVFSVDDSNAVDTTTDETAIAQEMK